LRNSRIMVSPSITGMLRSVMIRSNFPPIAACNPSAPSQAYVTP
jgi:hypothetical protein